MEFRDATLADAATLAAPISSSGTKGTGIG